MVSVHRIFHEARRHELGLAHGPGPGARHDPAVDMVMLQDLQGRQEFVPEEGSAIARIGQGRESLDRIGVSSEAAEIGLHAPDAEHDGARHAVGAFDGH